MSRRSRMSAPRLLSDLLGDAVRGGGLAERLREADIWRVWPDVVGATVASRARPLRIINGTLTVAVSSGPWMQELRFLSAMMLQKLNDHLGGEVVRDIVFKSGKIAVPPADEPEEKVARKRITPKQKQFIEDQAALLDDRDTREAFMALMKASFERRQTA